MIKKKQFKYTLLILLLIALLLSSCATDDSFPNSSSDSTMVNLSFFISDGAMTRAINTANESTVSDITVLVFDHSGSLIGSKYVSSVSVTSIDVPVTARSATGCTIYAIANTGSSSYFAGVNTISQLNTMSTTIASASALESTGSTSGSTGALMVGKSSVDILAGGANKFSMFLYHQCSKFSFTITPASGVTVTGYQLCNVPLSSYITDSHVPASASTVVGPPAGYSSYGNFDAVSGLSQNTALSKTYYIYENFCGSKSNATKEELRSSSSAPSSASYLLVNANGSGWASTYRIYLGGVTNTDPPATDLTNFNVYRNLNYKCNISLATGGSNGDARVTYTAILPNPVVGQYFYSDGTWGAYASVYGKTTIGFIFSAYGPHGCAVALTDASTSCNWYNAPGVVGSYTAGGKSGWRLPSSNELLAINTAMANAYLTSYGMYKSNLPYWSNTEINAYNAYFVNFYSDGSTLPSSLDKNYTLVRVRAVINF